MAARIKVDCGEWVWVRHVELLHAGRTSVEHQRVELCLTDALREGPASCGRVFMSPGAAGALAAALVEMAARARRAGERK
jgi:hypothetical protein